MHRIKTSRSLPVLATWDKMIHESERSTATLFSERIRYDDLDQHVHRKKALGLALFFHRQAVSLESEAEDDQTVKLEDVVQDCVSDIHMMIT